MGKDTYLVSFVIPTRNSERTLDKCLHSIRMQDYGRVEIIIVDGYSRDSSFRIAKRYADHVLRCSGTYGAASQLGIKNSNGDILGWFDSDVIFPHSRWLSRALKLFDEYDVGAVWPMQLPPPDSSWVNKCFLNHSWGIIAERIKCSRGLLGGSNSLIRREAIDAAHGTDPSLHWGADFFLAERLRKAGFKVLLYNDPIYHDSMITLNDFLRKQFHGARTFTSRGFEMMNLTTGLVIYEQMCLGTKNMLKGLFCQRDPSWLMFPLLMTIRTAVYALCHFRTIL